MDKLRDMMAYFCEKYPHKKELSNARLTKMIYLADWKSAIEAGHQISELNWVFNHYGPFLDDVLNLACESPDFTVSYTINRYGGQKAIIGLSGQATYESLTQDDKEYLDHVIEQTKGMYWDKFIQLVYSTYPVVATKKYSELNLCTLAAEYQELIRDL